MKKEYQKPEQRVVLIEQQCHILSDSEELRVYGNGNMNYGGGSSGPARARRHGHGLDEWDDEEDYDNED